MRTTPFGLLLSLLLVAPASAGPILVVLGDSSAFGETDGSRNPSNGDRGYVRPFADWLANNGPNAGIRPEVLNLAVNGESSTSFFSGTGRGGADGQAFNTNYTGQPAGTAQSDRLHALLGSPEQAGRVKNVVVQLGANDLNAVSAAPDFLTISDAERRGRLGAAFAQLQTEYVSILGDVKARFPDADVYMVGYHNPYNGDPSHPFYAVADPAVQGLNQLVWGLSEADGAKYVDVYGISHPNERHRTLIGLWRTDPANAIHLNDAGYAAVGSALIQEAGGPIATPEPGTLILVAVAGVGGVGGWLARRRKKSALPA